MSVSFDSALTLQAATSHQCSRDANGDGEGGRNGYHSDSAKATLTREKMYVDDPEDHDQIEEEPSDSEEAPCSINSRTRHRRMEKAKKRVEIQEEDDDSDPVSDDEGLDVEEADDLNDEGVGATQDNPNPNPLTDKTLRQMVLGVCHMRQEGNTTAVVWMNKKPVYVLSSAHQSTTCKCL